MPQNQQSLPSDAPFPFFKCSPEVRNMIYRLVWRAGPRSKSESSFDIAAPYHGPPTELGIVPKPHFFEVIPYSVMEGNLCYSLEGYSMLFVNKQMHHEAMAVGARECKLQMMVVDDDENRSGRLLKAWQKKNSGLMEIIKEITIHVDEFDVPQIPGRQPYSHVGDILNQLKKFKNLDLLRVVAREGQRSHMQQSMVPFIQKLDEPDFPKIVFHFWSIAIFSTFDLRPQEQKADLDRCMTSAKVIFKDLLNHHANLDIEDVECLFDRNLTFHGHIDQYWPDLMEEYPFNRQGYLENFPYGTHFVDDPVWETADQGWLYGVRRAGDVNPISDWDDDSEDEEEGEEESGEEDGEESEEESEEEGF